MIADTATVLDRVGAPWAFAGGWALDLAQGRASRPHRDVDVAVFRADQNDFRSAFVSWHCEQVVAGQRVPWRFDEWIAPPVHELYASSTRGNGLTIELLLNERAEHDWVYRRDPVVRRSVARVLQRAPSGVPVLAPEIVLLYKSKAPRDVDWMDLENARPLLDSEAVAWLSAALRRASPDHPWLTELGPREA